MKNLLIAFLSASLCYSPDGYGQDRDDTLRQELEAVQIRAFEQFPSLQQIPAAVSYIGPKELQRFNNTNIVQAVNTVPGVRMEERSPGSYRLSIRGSSLRAPFGVRNVKIYYNDIPFTDPGGHTYLNQLGFYNFHALELIKGPGSSLYGAGTGGAMLIRSVPETFRQGATAAVTGGSYGLQHLLGEVRFGHTGGLQNTVRYQHFQSDGYREHSALRRTVFSWDTKARLSRQDELEGHFFYGDLYYQTPGALTQKEYEQDPRMARPAVPVAPGFSIPGAAEMRAAIYEKTFLSGLTLRHQFTPSLQNATTVYGAYSQLQNPTIRNYGRSSEPHAGGRTTFKYRFGLGGSVLDWLVGGELQQGFTTVRTYQSVYGTPDTLDTDDELRIRQWFGFTQLSWQHTRWVITAGLSLNQQQVSFTRFSNPPAMEFRRDFDNQLAPRLAALYKYSRQLSIYGSAAKGFSPPTSAELSPSGGVLNASLNAEEGWNYELGARGLVLDERLRFDVNAFHFRLINTIVLRRDSLSGDYFLNAGSTSQTGIETQLSYQLNDRPGAFLQATVWASHTWYDFRYDQFIQVDHDFSGNRLPSVAPHTLAAGADLSIRPGLYAHLSYYYSDRIALDDANSAFADPYNLVCVKVGFRKEFAGRYLADVFAGGENLLDETYSLGNDINGFGGRYYNAAPGASFYAGISFSINKARPVPAAGLTEIPLKADDQ